MRASTPLAVLAFTIAALGLAPMAANAQQAPPLAVPGTGTAYRIYADTVANGEKAGVQGVPCVNQSIFAIGEPIVWRAVIADGPTGVALTPAEVARRGIQVAVSLADGTKVRLLLGGHPPPPGVPVHEGYWSGLLPIKPGHPTGTMPWTLTVIDNQGHTGTFTPPGQASGSAVLTVVDRGPAAAK